VYDIIIRGIQGYGNSHHFANQYPIICLQIRRDDIGN